jgi:zinc transporter ZupT
MTTTFALVSFLSGLSVGVLAVAIQTEVVVPEVGRITSSRSVDMPYRKARNMPAGSGAFFCGFVKFYVSNCNNDSSHSGQCRAASEKGHI